MLLDGWQEVHPACKKLSGGVLVMCLGQDADLHMAQLMPLPLTISCFSKSRLVLPSWYQLTRVVLDKIQEGCKTVVCVCACICVCDIGCSMWITFMAVFMATFMQS